MHRLMNSQKRALPGWVVIPRKAEFLVGGLVCALAALAASALAAGHSWQVWMPLLFSAVLFFTAVIFGARAGLLGSLLAALIFAMFLFSPTGKISVANDTARTNLGWMLLTGIAFSFLFAPPRPRFPHR
jgi:K+-sensing histidine kinase KdpD